MKCGVFFLFKSGLLVTALVLSLLLASIPSYFYITQPASVSFGLVSVTYSGSSKPYSEFEKTCESLEVSGALCENLRNINKAGKVLLALLIADLFLLTFLVFVNFGQYYAVRKVLGNKTGQVSRVLRTWIRFCFRARPAILLHPVLVNLGCGVWVKMSKIEEFSKEIRMSVGIVGGIIQCFLSLLGIAVLMWEVSASRRRAARFLGKGGNGEGCKDKKKLDSGEVNSENSYVIENSV